MKAAGPSGNLIRVHGQRSSQKAKKKAHCWLIGGVLAFGVRTHTKKSLMKLKKNLERPLYWDWGTKMLLLELEIRLEHGTRTFFRLSRPKVQWWSFVS